MVKLPDNIVRLIVSKIDMSKRIMKAFDSGDNMFITGAAGCGKTFNINQLITHIKEKELKIGITSSTAASALLIGGRTVHSYLGIGLGTKEAPKLASSLRYKNKTKYDILRDLDVLIIDEISLLDADFIDKLSDYLAIVRGKRKVFGGLQIIFSGDFLQLSPVKSETYAFQSKAWKLLRLNNIVLTKMMRQIDDLEFQHILEELRFGRCSDAILERLEQLKYTKFEGDIKPTLLYSRNIDVDAINSKQYQKLVDAGATKKTYTSLKSSHPNVQHWVDSNKFPERIEVCIGAQVILTANVDPSAGLFNGSRGIVTELGTLGPTVKFVDGREIVIERWMTVSEDNKRLFIECIPLRLAWCLTIHRSQGMTIDRLVVSLKDCFTYGQAYVAISRARDLASIKVVDAQKTSFKCSQEVVDFYKSIM